MSLFALHLHHSCRRETDLMSHQRDKVRFLLSVGKSEKLIYSYICRRVSTRA